MNMGRLLRLAISFVTILLWSNTPPKLCRAWVSTASSTSSSGSSSSSTSTFSSFNNAANTKGLSGRKIGTLDKRYWMVLNAVVDKRRHGMNGTTIFETAISTSKDSKSKIKKTNKIFVVDRWNSMFERLKDYKKRYGNTNVPKNYDGGSPSLGNWVAKQRFEFMVYQNTNGKEGQITLDRISKLESIGFLWELRRQEWEERWQTMFTELKAFQEKYLSTKVPIFKDAGRRNGGAEYTMFSLGLWVKTQRIQRNRLLRNEPAPAMTKERLEMLESIGFSWKGKRVTDYDKWLSMYFKLMFYYQQHNTTIVSDSHGEGSSRLLKWTQAQRDYYRNLDLDENGFIQNFDNINYDDITSSAPTNTLTQHRIDLLNEINFDWSYCHEDRSWDDMYDELLEYKENFNSTLVSTSINEGLGKWTILQRTKYNSGSSDLDEQQIFKLNHINFDWNATDDVNWNAMMERLEAYKRKYDTTIVPTHDGGDIPLANWVNNQRFKLGKYVLNDEGEYYDDRDLVERIAVDLGCTPQCEFEPKGFIQKISPSTKATRIRRLHEIGFVWDAQEASWQDMYRRLLEYKERNNGSTSVPFSSENYTRKATSKINDEGDGEDESESLGLWVRIQRQNKQVGQMSEKRIFLLNEIDFVWDIQDAQWTEMFDRLCRYQQQHDGSTMVPRSYPPDPKLGLWLNTQRSAYKRKRLARERIDRLDAIGFVW
eukprot:CAMPEP_0197177260 /NCGR_PEP_ID=MMETSP1423-20130617/2932_1 /TAXON_ID=476441 /ORGANISM="Pseudo-nitzschia heimii, Strain UNC1101" /LENGTH=708 /DNA_ID=CAMNT_0042626783 /DNA_START=191 /DNA_END=2314 /DNA_ORIENTATION=+